MSWLCLLLSAVAQAADIQGGYRPVLEPIIQALPRDLAGADRMIADAAGRYAVPGVLAKFDELKDEEKALAYSSIEKAVSAKVSLEEFPSDPGARQELVILVITDRFKRDNADAARIAKAYRSSRELTDLKAGEEDLARANELLGSERTFLEEGFRQALEKVRPSLAERVSRLRFGPAQALVWEQVAEHTPLQSPGEPPAAPKPSVVRENKNQLMGPAFKRELTLTPASLDGRVNISAYVDREGRIVSFRRPSSEGLVEVGMSAHQSGYIETELDLRRGSLSPTAHAAVLHAVHAYNEKNGRHLENAPGFAPVSRQGSLYSFPGGSSFTMELGRPGSNIFIRFMRNKKEEVEAHFNARDGSDAMAILNFDTMNVLVGIGSDKKNPARRIVIKDPQVSSGHAVFKLMPGHIWISNKSKLGTRVRGLRPAVDQSLPAANLPKLKFETKVFEDHKNALRDALELSSGQLERFLSEHGFEREQLKGLEMRVLDSAPAGPLIIYTAKVQRVDIHHKFSIKLNAADRGLDLEWLPLFHRFPTE